MRQRSTRQDRSNPGKGGRQADLFIIVTPASLEAWPSGDGGEALGKDGLDATWRRATPLWQGPGSSESARGGGLEGVEDTCRESGPESESESVSVRAVAATACSWRYEVGGQVEAPAVALGLTHKLFS
jgi:hypothetical protein